MDKLPVTVESEIRALLSDCETPRDLVQKMINMEQAECPVSHTFVGNSYIREINAKAGTFLVGHYQKTKHINMFVKGKVAMYEADGSFKILTAPMYFVGEPGRKVGYIIEDMTWINIYATAEKDINKIENQFLDKTIEAEIDFKKVKIDHITDHVSYREVIDRLGFTEEEVQAMTGVDNIIDVHGYYGYKVDNSDIHGQGVFATMSFMEGNNLGLMRTIKDRTVLGRYTNHSASPNAKAVMFDNGDIHLVATKPIKGCKGGQNGDEITVDYEHTFNLSTGGIK